MVEQSTSIYVDKFYEMDPEFEVLLPVGTQLQNNMIVLVEDHMLRVNLEEIDKNRYEEHRARESNRWCVVSELKIIDRRMNDFTAPQNPLVTFIATYADGVQRKRSYDSSYAWIVKRESIPNEEIS